MNEAAPLKCGEPAYPLARLLATSYAPFTLPKIRHVRLTFGGLQIAKASRLQFRLSLLRMATRSV